MNSNSEYLAELLGIMYGDGCLSKSGGQYTIYISGHKTDDYEYHVKNTTKLFDDVFNKKIKISTKKSENTIFIRFRNKKIFNTFVLLGLPIGRKYSDLKLPEICNVEMNFKAFARGLFDTDGCFVLSKQHRIEHYYPRIEISSKSKTFLIEILNRLELLGFYGSISNKGKDNFRLELPGNNNLELWMKLIGTNNPTKRNKIAKVLNTAIPETFISNH